MVDDEVLPAVVRSLLGAHAARPDDTTLTRHLVAVLLEHDQPARAAGLCARLLAADPRDAEAARLLGRATAALRGTADGPDEAGQADRADPPVEPGFDWAAAQRQVADIAVPPLDPPDGDESTRHLRPVHSDLRLDDVGGMTEVKQRLHSSFLEPARHPELSRRFGRGPRGGLLLHGPPGCGKTFLARAVAGELGARFHTVALADVLDMWLGASERNLHETFELARAHTPCVLFLDEIDALGQKRSMLAGHSAMRGIVNQLLVELDSVHGGNDGVFVLAATNRPWDVDDALQRPGRLDRTLFVGPPDTAARRAIVAHHLRGRPVDGVDLDEVAAATADLSGADLALVCDTAAEAAFADSVRTGRERPIGRRDLRAAIKQVRPSTGSWFDDARNVVMFGNRDGRYDDLAAYLATRRRR